MRTPPLRPAVPRSPGHRHRPLLGLMSGPRKPSVGWPTRRPAPSRHRSAAQQLVAVGPRPRQPPAVRRRPSAVGSPRPAVGSYYLRERLAVGRRSGAVGRRRRAAASRRPVGWQTVEPACVESDIGRRLQEGEGTAGRRQRRRWPGSRRHGIPYETLGHRALAAVRDLYQRMATRQPKIMKTGVEACWARSAGQPTQQPTKHPPGRRAQLDTQRAEATCG